MELMEWLKGSWAYILAFAAGLGTILNLSKNIKELKTNLTKPFTDLSERLEKVEKENKAEEELIASQDKRQKTLEEQVTKGDQKINCLSDGMVSLLRDRINAYYFIKINERGFIKPSELEIVNDLYEAYKSLGGNGLVAREMEIINKFPVFEKEENYNKWLAKKKKKTEDD